MVILKAEAQDEEDNSSATSRDRFFQKTTFVNEKRSESPHCTGEMVKQKLISDCISLHQSESPKSCQSIHTLR